MPSRLMRMTFLALAATLTLSPPAPAAAAPHSDPECAALENSARPAPDWYAERCLGGAAATDYSNYQEVAGFVPGDLAYYKNNFPAPQNVKTAPLATLAFTTIGPNTNQLYAMSFNLAATTLYAVNDTTRQLGTISETTGAFTPIAAINPDPGASFAVLGLAFDPISSNVYLSLTDGDLAGARLFRINVANAALTTVGTITNTPFPIDLAIDNTGQMYSHDVSAETLIRIDKNTGAPTVVGPTGMEANFAQGMMYDRTDDTLYGCAFVIAPVQQGQLVRFDKTTGLATVVAGPVPDELECALKGPAPAADIAISITDSPDPVGLGANLVYTMTVTNNGPNGALGVQVSDPTPAGLIFVSNTGSCTTPFPCALGAVPAGQSRVITATFQVPAAYGGPNPIVNQATVTSPTPDPDGANNAADTSTTVTPPQPSASVEDVAYYEGSSGTTMVAFTVSLDSASGQVVTVDYATVDGTAVAGSDYQAVADTVTFAPGSTAESVVVLVQGDTVIEPNEYFFLDLVAATNAAVGDGRAVGMITDDDPDDLIFRDGFDSEPPLTGR